MAKQYTPQTEGVGGSGTAYYVGRLQKDIYADWEQSGGSNGPGLVGSSKGNRLPFEPALQKTGRVPFTTKG